MPRKLTNEEFVAKLQNIQPNIMPLKSYVNTYTTIKCITSYVIRLPKDC